MKREILTAVWLVAAAAPAMAQAEPVWNRMSVGQARSLIEAEGGKVEEVSDTDTGEYVINARSSDKLPFKLKGYDCRGAGDSKSCVRFELSAFFRLDDPAQAQAVEHSLAINWLADQSGDDGYLDVWRMGSLEGGVTRAHMRYQLQAFIAAVWAAQEVVYPPKTARGAPANG